MANTPQCPVCGQDVHTGNQHKDCRAAVLEDLLLQVQKHISEDHRKPLPQELRVSINKLSLTPLNEFLEQKCKHTLQPLQKREEHSAQPVDWSRYG